MIGADFQRTHRFQKALFEISAHAHHFAGGFHLRGKFVACPREFIERKPRHFRYDVIERGFETCGRVGKTDFIQREPDGDFCRNAGDGKAACFACQRGRTRNAGVHFDNVIAERIGIKRELHVTAAFDFQRADDFQRGVAEHLIFFVGKRLAGAYHDGIARMHADGIEIFHIAYDDGGIVFIAHDFVFDFFIPFYALFDEHFAHGGKLQRVFHHFAKFRFVIGKSAARAAERERGTKHYGIADFFRRFYPLFHAVRDFGRTDGFADFFA